jgi:hypothetical protein
LNLLGKGIWLTVGFLPLCIGLGMLGIYYLTRGPAIEQQPPPPVTVDEQAGLDAGARS